MIIHKQVASLIRKNAQVLSRTPLSSVLLLAAPLLTLLLAGGLSHVVLPRTSSVYGPVPDPQLDTPGDHLVRMPLCNPALDASSPGCRAKPRFFYTPNDAYHSAVMATLAADLKLDPAVDIIPLADFDVLAERMVAGAMSMANERAVNFAVSFTTFAPAISVDHEVSTGALLPKPMRPATLDEARPLIAAANGTYYTLWSVNLPKHEPGPDPWIPVVVVDRAILPVAKHALDTAILRTRAQMEDAPIPVMNVSLSHFAFPYPTKYSDQKLHDGSMARDPSAFDDPDFVPSLGPALAAACILLGFAPIVMRVIGLAATEKYSGLLDMLRRQGTSELAYWTSMFATLIILVVVGSAVSLLALPLLPNGLPMAHWDPLLLFVIQLLTGLHFGAIGMLSVAAVSTEYVNNLVAGFLTVGCIIGTGVIGLADAVALAGVNPEQTSVYESLLSTPVADTLLSFLLFFALGKVVFEIGPQDTRGNIARRTLADPALRAMNTFTRKFYSDLGGFRDFRIVEIEWSTSSTLHSMALMAASVAVAFFLCWYLNQIVGSVQSPWFIFSPSYWGVSGQRGNAKLHAQSKDADAVMVEQLQVQFSPTYFGLSFSALFFAVKDVSLSVSKGQVLSLLGRNGAGKSTTINCVTGLLRPSAGAVSCFGEGRPEHIQRMIGVTAQDDLTWPFLTAAEHIQLFATLKGLDKDMRQYAIDKLTMVGLEDHADQLVGEFSGGMRRRLCIVLSSVGEPPLVILDEPTSSLDPINRRKVWRFIASLKSHAAVILTTHLLDEADALGDSITIIDGGNVIASGSSLALKAQYGTGYEISILAHPHATLEDLTSMITARAPLATVVQRSNESFLVTLPKDDNAVVSSLLGFLQSDDLQRTSLVREWQVANTTLEEVFQNLVTAVSAPVLPDTISSDVGAPVESEEPSPTAVLSFDSHVTFPRQALAVALKHWTYQRRQLKATLFILLLSIGSFAAAPLGIPGHRCTGGYIGIEMPQNSDADFVASPTQWGSPFQLGLSQPAIPATCDQRIVRHRIMSAMSLCSPGSPLGCFAGDWALPLLFSVLRGVLGIGDFSLNSDLPGGSRFWASGPTEAVDSLLHPVPNGRNWTDALRQHTSRFAEFATPLDFNVTRTDSDAKRVIEGNIQRMNQSSFYHLHGSQVNCDHTSKDTIYDEKLLAFSASQWASYAVDVAAFGPSGTSLRVAVPPGGIGASYGFPALSLGGECSSDISTFMPIGFQGSNSAILLAWKLNQLRGQGDKRLFDTWSGHYDTKDWPIHELLASIANSQLRATLTASAGNNNKTSNEQIFGMVLPSAEIKPVDGLMRLVTFGSTFGVMFLFAAYLAVAFADKESRLLDFYRVNGLSLVSYWTGTYLFALSFSIPSIVIGTLITASTSSSIKPLTFALLALVLVHGSIALALLVAALVPSLMLARFLAFLLPALAAAVSSAISLSVSRVSVWATLLPTMPFSIYVHNLTLGQAPDWAMVGVSFAVSTVYLLVAMVLLTVEDMGSLFSFARRSHPQHEASGHEEEAEEEEEEDVEVRRERLALAQSGPGDTTTDKLAVRVVNVSQQFGVRKVLKGIHLAIRPGDTFGLLGHNGCGKTTLINILTGSAAPAGGAAWVAGRLTTEADMSAVVGVVPQTDMVMRDLTVAENLRLFARIRGAPVLGSALEGPVRSCAEAVGLGGKVLARPAGQLSGGMRRRLSIAIALIGSPAVILADEPSSGLDPTNRVGVWKLLGTLRERGDAAIMLTTHSMTEAEALCTRIGIMAGGKMRVLGDQVDIRARYGTGTSLHMQLPVAVDAKDSTSDLAVRALAAENAAMDLVVAALKGELLGDATTTTIAIRHGLQDALAGTRARGGVCASGTWRWEVRVSVLLAPGTDLTRVFAFVASGGIEGVVDFGLNNCSLEDVFIQVSGRFFNGSA